MSPDAPRPAGRTGPVRVVLADDQRLVRESLGLLLGLLDGIELLGSAADGEEALALVDRHRPDVVLMDIRMPRLDGIEATRRLRERHPDVRVIALTTYADDESVLGALRAGARGYLTKDASSDDIRAAILTVADGEAALDPAVQHHVVAALSDDDGSCGNRGRALPARRAYPARGGGSRADRRGALERRDRRPAVGHPDDGQVTYQPPVREGGDSRPRPGNQLRLPQRARDAAQLSQTRASGFVTVGAGDDVETPGLRHPHPAAGACG